MNETNSLVTVVGSILTAAGLAAIGAALIIFEGSSAKSVVLVAGIIAVLVGVFVLIANAVRRSRNRL